VIKTILDKKAKMTGKYLRENKNKSVADKEVKTIPGIMADRLEILKIKKDTAILREVKGKTVGLK
jgi:hypothetical protein